MRNGNEVFGVEPNQEMRQAGEQQLRDSRLFTSIDGCAEATTLSGGSVDRVVAGQAFHWFDRPRAKAEFRRILRPPGWVALIWNERKTDTTPFLIAYEGLLKNFATDYSAIDHRNITDEIIAEFFRPAGFTLKTYENQQVFDFTGLKGRLLSSSYAPPPAHPRHEAMLAALSTIFQRHQTDDRVAFDYATKMYVGRVNDRSTG